MFLFPLILIFLSPSLAQSFRLYHRLFHPSLPEQNFVKRGSIIEDVDGKFRVQSLSSTLQHQLPLAETSEHVTDVLYQLALDPGKTDSLWLISSVKACHLGKTANEHLVIHLPSPGGTPFAFNYFIDPIPLDGTCPPNQVLTSVLALPGTPRSHSHLRVNHRYLRAPPPVTATGDPVPVEPEKTFLQKYWLYILLALGALLIAPGGEEAPRAS
ncbi:hypothetical protein BGW80DRAFT_1456079 [Lactifluus volemus]|nr:hypothetical protein BGW80DRAFT_1456079 [Lactifluus volemus]